LKFVRDFFIVVFAPIGVHKMGWLIEGKVTKFENLTDFSKNKLLKTFLKFLKKEIQS
jgi:hypothetical protein